MNRPNPNQWFSFAQVLALYGVKTSQKLSMQLKRFPTSTHGKFAVERGGKAGRKISRMKISKPLHQYLERLNKL